MTLGLDLERVASCYQTELRQFAERHPRSGEYYQENLKHWLYGAPRTGCSNGRGYIRSWSPMPRARP